MLSINYFSFSSPCSQRKNISSIYFHRRCGLNSPFGTISSSSSAINRTNTIRRYKFRSKTFIYICYIYLLYLLYLHMYIYTYVYAYNNNKIIIMIINNKNSNNNNNNNNKNFQTFSHKCLNI